MHLHWQESCSKLCRDFHAARKRIRRAFVLVACWSTMGPMKLKILQRDSGLRLMKHVPVGKTISAVALTAMLALGAHAADDSCVRTAANADEQGVFALDGSAVNSESLKVECAAGSVERLLFHLEPGDKQQVVLSVAPETAYEIIDGEADFIGGTAKDTDEGRRAITVEVAAPESARTGDTLTGALKLSGENGIEISVVLEVTGKDKLFRSDFGGADPLIGQFSLVR